MTTTNLNTATSAAPRVLVAHYVPSTGAAQYQADIGTTADLVSVTLHNTDTVSRTVTFSVVMAGGAAGGGNRRLETVTMAAKATIDLGQMMLGDGDFIWAEAGTASTIALTVTGIEFSNATGAVITGIRDDAIGSGGHGTGSATGTNAVGMASDRYLFASLLVQPSTFVAYAAYDTLTMTCAAGALTRLVSCDFNYGSGAIGSVHLFGLDEPTSASTQTLVGTAAKSGVTMGCVMGSISKSGVGSVTGAFTDGPTTVSALSLAITSAAGHVPMFAGAFRDVPLDFNLRTRYFNGLVNAGITVPQWLLMGDALGASTVTATTSNTSYHAAVGVDVVPA